MIGGAPSTGSSLLRQILNRHSNIYCGPETRLLSIKALYKDWPNQKKRIFKKGPLGVRPSAWHNVTGILCTGVELYQNQKEVREIIQGSPSFEDFISGFFEGLLEKNDKNFWAEKTPNNVYTVQAFLDSFPRGKVILTLRNPLDIVCSLMDKGNSLFSSLSHTLIHLALAASYEKNNRVYTVTYEHLTQQPERAMREICGFIGQSFEPEMLTPQRNQEVQGKTKLPGWRYSEIDPVCTIQSNRFEQLHQELKSELIAAMQMLVFCPENERAGQKPARQFATLYDHLPYSAPHWSSYESSKIYRRLLKEKRKDQQFRIRKLQLKFLKNYPISLRKVPKENKI